MTYNNTATSISNDYLWLLSCGEIWSSGYNGGATRGYAIGTEGKQYEWYRINETAYNSANNKLKKPSTVTDTSSSGTLWWLRSPYCNRDAGFCYVNTLGNCTSNNAGTSYGVAPGFSI